MARRTTPRKLRPDAPLCPPRLDEAPGELANGAVWDGVLATMDVVTPGRVADVAVKESRLVGVDLSGRHLSRWAVRDTHFERCDLSGATFDDTTLDRVVFTGCRLIGTTLEDCRLDDVAITDCVAELITLRAVTATTVVVESTGLPRAELSGLRARDCAFLDCDLSEADLDGAQLSGTRLHRSTLTDVHGALALRGCTISADQLVPVGAALMDALGITVTE